MKEIKLPGHTSTSELELDPFKLFTENYGLMPVIIPDIGKEDYMTMHNIRSVLGDSKVAMIKEGSAMGKFLQGNAPTIKELFPQIEFKSSQKEPANDFTRKDEDYFVMMAMKYSPNSLSTPKYEFNNLNADNDNNNSNMTHLPTSSNPYVPNLELMISNDEIANDNQPTTPVVLGYAPLEDRIIAPVRYLNRGMGYGMSSMMHQSPMSYGAMSASRFMSPGFHYVAENFPHINDNALNGSGLNYYRNVGLARGHNPYT